MLEKMVRKSDTLDYETNLFTGSFCTELLQKQCTWTPTTSLVHAIKAVVDHIDNPNIEYAVSVGTYF